MKQSDEQIGEKFIKDVVNHKMAVIADDGGVCRSLSFSKGSFDQAFQITTWPNYLCISGDMGTLVFERMNDMFNFFGSEKLNPKGGHYINTGYWAEKLQAGDNVKEFSEGEAKQAVKDWLVDWEFEDICYKPSDEVLQRILDSFDCDYSSRVEFIDNLPGEVDLGDFDGNAVDSGRGEEDCIIDVSGFVDYINGQSGGDYVRLDGYTRRYIWLLNAIVWGISQYRDSKGVEVAA